MSNDRQIVLHNRFKFFCTKKKCINDYFSFNFQATNPYLTGLQPVNNAYTPYFTQSPMMPAIMGSADHLGVGNSVGVPQTMTMQQKIPRSDRLEVGSIKILCLQ